MTAVTKKVVDEAFRARDRVFCEYCGREVFRHVFPTATNRAVGDHRVPRARGGSNGRNNIAVVCNVCDKAKGTLTEAEFRDVQSDHAARKLLQLRVVANLDPGRPIYATRDQREAARVQRQYVRLEGRRKLPDENCIVCDGTGIRPHMGRRGQIDPCRCSIVAPRGFLKRESLTARLVVPWEGLGHE